MAIPVERFVSTFSALSAIEGIQLDGEPPTLFDAGFNHAAESDSLVEMFEGVTGMSCPQEFCQHLTLPDQTTLRWHGGAAAGEIDLANPLVATGRCLDASLFDETIDRLPMREMRILDATTVLAGPIYVLFRMSENGIDPSLILSDLREVNAMDVDLDEYLDLASASRSLIFWQYLTIERRLTADRAKALKAGLAFLRNHVPAAELRPLETRLAERS